ncbi:peptide/nickel transport system ATP-binding protein [Plasticicumulans lactativorans]|uniref:Peptide/nickel transport system ATP-binding protein n=1 Tax=Plasticicumulans lactativorans TaxID=1133106 RepID=A0A4R2L9Z5_9GAMM|nr:ABC transporter ATP-binding protein [Plasticicumulans lactativorans]TCO79598.1 peptide/nickel transport system ATP-binding protein [Plasticicumulans lactativorans]
MANDQATAAGDLLRVEDLHIGFHLHGGLTPAVRGASLRIRPGKVTALVGESGSGKSVIAQAILGILPTPAQISGGRILFNDPLDPGASIDIAALAPDSTAMRALRGGRIAMIFQEPMTSLSPLHTIGDQIEEALRLHRSVSHEEARPLTEEMLGLVGFPRPARAYDRYPFELSGGLRQRAMIAMALICHPALLIADEPTTALDVTIQAQILKLLKDLQARLGMAVLLITHDLGVVANMADEVAVIYHGRIMEAGTVEAIFSDPRHPYLKALLAAVPHFDMHPGERLVALRNVPVQTDALVGLRPPPRPRDPGATAPDVLLRVRGLTHRFAVRQSAWRRGGEPPPPAVNDVSFEIRRGECLGLVGESGCGKTTVSKIIMRALTPSAGELIFDGGDGPRDLLAASGSELVALRTRVQMVFQDPFSSLSPRMTVGAILREPLEIHGIGTSASRTERVRALLRAVGLDPRHASRYPHSFSGGQRQRIGIARALALGPDLLICDEPVSALDVSVQAQILNLLEDLQRELGLTYLFISHNLAVVDYVADRIAVMCRGRIVELAPREVLFRAPVHPYTRTLLGAVPYPDLGRPLDFATLTRGGATDPGTWPGAFRDCGEGPPLQPIEVGAEHWVLAHADADARELRP